MRFCLTNSRGEVIETSQCDIEMSSEDVYKFRSLLQSLSAKFNKMKAEFLIMTENGRKTFALSDICELENEANTAYLISLQLISKLSLIEHNLVDYQLLVDEKAIKEANFKSLI